MSVKGDSISLKIADLAKLDNQRFFQILYRSYYQTLRANAFYYLKEKELADDVVQDVFFKVWMKMDDLRADIESGVWAKYLIVMTRNRALNINKKRSVTIERSVDCESCGHMVFNGWMQRENELMLEGVVKALPARQREVFVMNYQGFDTREISKELKIAYSTARNTLMYAVKKLEAYVNKTGEWMESVDELMPAA